MNIQINREKLLPSLISTASVVEKRQTLPILSNLLLTQVGDTLNITGSDLEVEVNKKVTGLEPSEANVTLAAGKLLDICRALPKEANIKIEILEDKAILKSGRSKFTLKTLPSEDYPSLQTIDFEERVDVPAKDLLHILDLTSFSMAVHDVRYYLNGVYLEFKENRGISVATDGHRLSKSELELSSPVGSDRSVIIPRKAILEIARFLHTVADGKGEGLVRIESNKKHIRVSAGDTVLTSTLVDGQFPEYQSILDVNLDKQVTIDRLALLESLQRMAVLTNDRLHGVGIELSENLIHVKTNNPEQEEAQDEIPCEYEGQTIKTSFNVNYFIDALKIIDADQVYLKLKDKDSVCVIVNPDDDKSTWLVMPMRL